MLTVTHGQFRVIEQVARGRRYRRALVGPQDLRVWQSMLTAGIAFTSEAEYHLIPSVLTLYRDQRIAVENTRLTRTPAGKTHDD